MFYTYNNRSLYVTKWRMNINQSRKFHVINTPTLAEFTTAEVSVIWSVMLNPFKLSQSGSKAHLELVEGNGFVVNNAPSTHLYSQTSAVWLNSSRIWTGNYLSTARKTVCSEVCSHPAGMDFWTTISSYIIRSLSPFTIVSYQIFYNLPTSILKLWY